MLPHDLKSYKPSEDAFQILSAEEVAVVLGLLFALLLVMDLVHRVAG